MNCFSKAPVLSLDTPKLHQFENFWKLTVSVLINLRNGPDLFLEPEIFKMVQFMATEITEVVNISFITQILYLLCADLYLSYAKLKQKISAFKVSFTILKHQFCPI